MLNLRNLRQCPAGGFFVFNDANGCALCAASKGRAADLRKCSVEGATPGCRHARKRVAPAVESQRLGAASRPRQPVQGGMENKVLEEKMVLPDRIELSTSP